MIHGVGQAVVLVGGEGTRLRPLTNRRPKPLLPVLGRPCVEYSLRSLSSAGIGRVFLACGYRSDTALNALRDGSEMGLDMTYAFEEQPMGTAGAVKLLEKKLDRTFVVVMGDTLMDIDLEAVIRSHHENGAMVTIALTEVDRPTEFGIVGLDENDRIVRFKEKPHPNEVFSNLINAGVYVIEREAFSHVPDGTKFDFSKNLFPRLLEAGHPLYGSRLKGMWKDIGRPQDLLEANIRMAERRGVDMTIEGADVRGKVVASELRAKGATIRGPAFFGKGAVLGNGSWLIECAIGEGTQVGERAHIERSLVLSKAFVGPGAKLEGCVVGDACVVGEGAVLSDCILGDEVRVRPGESLKSITLE